MSIKEDNFRQKLVGTNPNRTHVFHRACSNKIIDTLHAWKQKGKTSQISLFVVDRNIEAWKRSFTKFTKLFCIWNWLKLNMERKKNQQCSLHSPGAHIHSFKVAWSLMGLVNLLRIKFDFNDYALNQFVRLDTFFAYPTICNTCKFFFIFLLRQIKNL